MTLLGKILLAKATEDFVTGKITLKQYNIRIDHIFSKLMGV